MRSRLSYLVVAGMAMVSMGAHAAVDWTWTLNSTPTGTNLPGSVSVVGYSASTNSSGLIATNATPNGTLPDLLWYSGGYGICSTGDAPCGDAPEHSMDNNGYKESMLLNFGSKVTLSWLDIGWKGTDSDLSVLAYTGTGTPTLTGSSYDSLLGNGWTLVGQYSNVITSTSLASPSLSLGTSTSSSYWLIGAYNSAFGNKGWTEGNDYVKLFAVAGNTASPPPPGKVSEPAALLLLGTGLIGAWGLRRRRECVN